MTRLGPIALLAASACALRPGASGPAGQGADIPASASPNVTAARALDQEGVKSFSEGRYSDAARYFRAARTLGGPASELWNIARSLERMDDQEGASRAIDEYLAESNLAPEDRAEAEREAQFLRARSSMLTVTTTPSGATIVIDGQAAATTPATLELRAGLHSLVLKHDGFATATRSVEARFGRAVIVAMDLVATGKR
jgi:hypothetical protein